MSSEDVFPAWIPGDHSTQVTAKYFACDLLAQGGVGTVLDLGCGSGDTRAWFEQHNPCVRWVGADIASSPEVDARALRRDVVTYDGVYLPFGAATFDLIYSRQVFEHVRYPEALLAETYRVLKPGGHFTGSASGLEPYHSRSLWNYTAWGFAELVVSAGFKVAAMRPGIDGPTLITRRLVKRWGMLDQFFEHESPLNWGFGMLGGLMKKSHRSINSTKLIYCGHFCFLALKPPERREGGA